MSCRADDANAEENPILWAIQSDNACSYEFVRDTITVQGLSHKKNKKTILNAALFGVVGSDREESAKFAELLLNYGADAAYTLTHDDSLHAGMSYRARVGESVLEHAIKAHNLAKLASRLSLDGFAPLVVRAGVQNDVVKVLLEKAWLFKNRGQIPSEHFQKALQAAYWKYPNVVNTFKAVDEELTKTTLASITALDGDLDSQKLAVEKATDIRFGGADPTGQVVMAAVLWNLPLVTFIINFQMALGNNVDRFAGFALGVAINREQDPYLERGFTEVQMTEFFQELVPACPESEQVDLIKMACKHSPNRLLASILDKATRSAANAAKIAEATCKDRIEATL